MHDCTWSESDVSTFQRFSNTDGSSSNSGTGKRYLSTNFAGRRSPRCQPPAFCYQLCTPNKSIHNKVSSRQNKVKFMMTSSHFFRITSPLQEKSTGGLSHKGPIMWNFEIFVVVILIKLNKHSICRWDEMWGMWRHCGVLQWPPIM